MKSQTYISLKEVTVRRHLKKLLKGTWKDYRDCFKCCRKDFSEASVHELRVGSRQLLALLNLLQSMVGDEVIEAPRRLVKEQLQRFTRLRDTQVQLLQTQRNLHVYPGATPFHNALQKRERRLIKQVGKCMRHARLKEIREAMSVVQQAARSKLTEREQNHSSAVLQEIDHAFSKVHAIRAHCHPNDVAAIHRMRVAFKQFRYMVELMHPVLPGVTKQTINRFRAWQTRMGKIQDAQVMIAMLDKFSRKKPKHAFSVRALRRKIERHLNTLVQEFLADTTTIDAISPLIQ